MRWWDFSQGKGGVIVHANLLSKAQQDSFIVTNSSQRFENIDSVNSRFFVINEPLWVLGGVLSDCVYLKFKKLHQYFKILGL